MSRAGKHYKPEQIVNMLREIDVKTSSGKTRAGASFVSR